MIIFLTLRSSNEDQKNNNSNFFLTTAQISDLLDVPPKVDADLRLSRYQRELALDSDLY